MRPTALLPGVPALLLSAVVLLAFHDKAFTIDDTVYLREAEHVLVDPLHPTAFDCAWNLDPERVSTIVPTGPVSAWVLVPAMLAGGSETAAHLTTLAFLWLAILATVSLGLRFGLAPLARTHLLLLVPVGALLLVDDLRSAEAWRHAIARFEEPGSGGRLMDRNGGAGFYSNSWGYLPWSWSDEPADSFVVGRLMKPK